MVTAFYDADANLDLLKGEDHCRNWLWQPGSCTGTEPA